MTILALAVRLACRYEKTATRLGFKLSDIDGIECGFTIHQGVILIQWDKPINLVRVGTNAVNN